MRGSISAASIIFNHAQLSGIYGSCTFLFGADGEPVHVWYTLFFWLESGGYVFDRLCEAFLAGAAVVVHGEFGGSVAGKGLGFFDRNAAFDDEVDIGKSAGVEVDFANGRVFRDFCRL
ncbi:MAG: hypothetical protein GKR89_30610 [Candidatus Latescibacteria bacterium]|nr:hypothetical protein [Candidatus Latescibacterota bacterium]